MGKYEHSETGWMMIVSMAAAAIFSTLIAFQQLANHGSRLPFLMPLLFLLLLLNLFKLYVRVDSGEVCVSFGIGLFTKRFQLAEIEEASLAMRSWYGGWGIRYTGKGWFYTVNSLKAVELKLKNGRVYMIGTDEPLLLLEAIQEEMKKTAPNRTCSSVQERVDVP